MPEPAPGTAAVGRWAADLREHGIDGMADRCWTMAPHHVRTMYAEPAPIFEAIVAPGAREGGMVVWRTAAVTVAARDRDIATGYACPYVFGSGEEIAFDAAEARHTVRRYLSRAVGSPLNAADTETAYPLLCPADSGWDPKTTGKPGIPPMASGARTPVGIKGFVDEDIKSEWPRNGYITVSVPVTTRTGVRTKQTFTLKSGVDGYCIGDVSG